MKKLLKFILAMTIAVITASCGDFGKPNLPPDVESTVEEYQEAQVTPEQAAKNMLAIREQYVWDNACDSVFRVMPEKIIIYITLHNPGFGTWDIGNEYLLKKELYDKLNEDINLVNNFKEQQGQQKPDTIPTKTELDKPNVLPIEN